MRLSSNIVIDKSKDEVWNFLAESQNIAKWDRGVKAIEAVEAGMSPGKVFVFTTVGYDIASNQGRMTYQIRRTEPVTGCRIDLISREGCLSIFG